MNQVVEAAHAKINLTLNVIRRREDGYHEVEMVMQSLELADIVRLRQVESGIRLKTSSAQIPAGKDNLAWRAAQLMFGRFECTGGLEIQLEKRIPVAAGLAGGSTDAAAVMRGINRLWGLQQSTEALCELGARLGSDVPFCVRGGTALARGRGELLTGLPDCPPLWLVLVKPPLGVSTAEVYGNLRLDRIGERPDNEKMIEALAEKRPGSIAAALGNVLEEVTVQMVPQVQGIKQELLRAGAVNAMMSGSGPTVFAIAEDENHARTLAKVFEHKEYTVIVTRTINQNSDMHAAHGTTDE